MRLARPLVNDISANPIARAVLACLLLATCVGSLVGVSYVDNYVNAGVAWGGPPPDIPLADVDPMGVNLFLEKEPDPANVVKSLDMAQAGGFKWIRQDFAWNDIEISAKGNFTDTRNPGNPVSSWAKYDFIVDQAVAHGITIMARLDSPPVWARKPGDDLETYHKGPPANNNDYGDFVAAVAARYKGKIKYYQIWNEPNLLGEWGGHPVNAEQYVALLKVAHDHIKAVDPDAVIVSAALAPTTEESAANRSDILFLEDMYREGAKPYFDIMSTMIYGLGQPPSDRRTDFKRLSFSRPVLLHEVMERNGDALKPIWISEYAWLSYPDDLQQRLNLSPDEWAAFQAKNIWGKSVDEQTQGQYLVEGYERARDEWPWMGVMFVWHLRNPDGDPLEPATYFSILNQDFTPRPAYLALQEYSKVVPSTPTPQSKPLLNALGFPFLYALFGLLALASFAFLGLSVGEWARAALNRPRGRYSERTRETARNGAAIVGMGACYALFYVVGNLPVIVVALAGYLVIAFFKPQAALAFVAFSIPFFWYPKVYGSQHFPVAETLVVMAFAALIARRTVAALLPRLWARLGQPGMSPITSQAVVVDLRATKPIPINEPISAPEQAPVAEAPEAVDLSPAEWPARPRELIAELAKPLPLNGEREESRAAARRRRSDDALPQANYLDPLLARFRAWNRQDAFAAPAVALLLIGALSMLTLANHDFAPDSARAYRWIVIEPVLLYFLLTDIIRTKRGLVRVLDFFVGAGVFVAFIGLWQFVGGSNTLAVEGVSRVMSVYEHPNNLALYLGRVAPFAACTALFLPWGWRKLLYALAALPLFATFLLTYSRGAWVGAAVAIVLAVSIGLRWPLSRESAKPTRAFRAWLTAVGVGAVAVAIAVVFLFPSLPDRFINPDSGVKRIDIWVSALKMGRDHPFFGIGQDQFLNQYQLKNLDGTYHYITKAQVAELYTSHPHNIVLDWWLSLGIMGLLVLVWLLWRYYREAINLARWCASKAASDALLRAVVIGLIAAMTDFLVHGLVDNSYFLMDLALIFWLSCGAIQLGRMLYVDGGRQTADGGRN
ncbi:MAG TPA: O-antigen ligase family protein [Chloroflexia bacterium]|nr:O-antigen ligase family protein [Chloroflexia bacterium]